VPAHGLRHQHLQVRHEDGRLKMKPVKVVLVLALTGLLTLAAAGWSEVRAQESSEDLAKKLQNPVASLISVPLQFNWDIGIGPEDASR